MGRKIFTILAALLPLATFAQLKVDSLGNVGINDTIFDNTKFSVFSTDMYAAQINALKTGLNISVAQTGYNGPHVGIKSYSHSRTSNLVWGLYSVTNNQRTTNVTNNRSIAVMGSASGVTTSHRNFGVLGNLNANHGAGVLGIVGDNLGVDVTGQYAGYFEGNVKVTGTIDGTLLNPSDMRLKENVETLGTGARGSILSTLSLLTPISYNYKDIPALYAQLESLEDDKAEMDELLDDDSLQTEPVEVKPNPILLKRHYGFSAQELQEIYPDLVYENDNGYLSVNYVELIPILVQAINELQDEISELRGDRALSKETMFDDDEAGTTDIETAVSEVAFMGQNVPNPFTEKTDIPVFIPQNVQQATLYIYDLSGKQLEQHAVDGRGETVMTIHADKMDAGMYVYSLITDGKVVTTRKMIVTK